MQRFGKKTIVAVAAIAAGAFIVAGTMLFGSSVERFFKERGALDAARMHMSEVKDGTYRGSLRFSDDIDFSNLALSQSIPVYGLSKEGELFRNENDAYAVYSNDEVVAIFGLYESELGFGTSMTNRGLGAVQKQLSNAGTCALVKPYDFAGEVCVAPDTNVVAVIPSREKPSELQEIPEEIPVPNSDEKIIIPFSSEPSQPSGEFEEVPIEAVGITPEMIEQIDFPARRDPIPFSV